MSEKSTNQTGARSDNLANKRVALYCSLFVGCMVGAAYAAVPLYDLFCRVTGYGGTTQVAEANTGQILDRTITIRFDANIGSSGLSTFRPVERTLDVKIGKNQIMNYEASNETGETIWTTASFNVSPDIAGIYFNKIECFCFTEQRLAAGQKVHMPVMFYVDPDLVNDPDFDNIDTITLSYTMFETEPETDSLAAKVEDKTKG